MPWLAAVGAWLAIGAFLAGWWQTEEAAEVMVVTLLWPVFPVMWIAARLRELVRRTQP